MRSRIRLALFALVISAIAIPLIIAGEENSKPSDSASTDNIAELKEQIKRLEARVQELEQSQAKLQELLRESKAVRFQRSLESLKDNQPLDERFNANKGLFTLPPGQPVPPNWTPHEFNGGTYYFVPLSKNPQLP